MKALFLNRAFARFVIFLAALVSGASAQTEPPLPDAAAITRMLDELWRSNASHSELTMTVLTSSATRELKLESWSQGSDLALVVVRAPARESGVATLKTGEGLWSYAPRADRLIRIPAGLLGDGWMGSHFTNDDLVRESSYETDYRAQLAWTMEASKRLLKVTLVPKPDAAVIYARVEFFLEPGSFVPIRSDYYDDKMLVRQMVYSDVREVNGKAIPHLLQLLPLDRKHKGEQTRLQYDNLATGVPVAKDLFTKQGLRRAATQP